MGALRGPQLLSLRIGHLRNLRSVQLAFREDSHRILLTGANGAGKTTLMEAVYLLARGRTFRGRKAGPLTSDGERRTLIEGRFRETDSSTESIVVFERSDRRSQRRYNGVTMDSISPRESPLRVKLVGENPQALLEGEPRLRRGLLDWNLFHVEHQLGQLRMDLRRVLAQRNAALRQARSGVSLWDPAFVELSCRITAQRATFVALWRTYFLSYAESFSFLDGCDLVFERGWSLDHDLPEILERGRNAEIQRGQTLAGAHRADVRVGHNGAPSRLSRGQAKVVVCLLQLAAERVHRAQGLAPSLWLLDDIDAELDPSTASRLWGLFSDLDAQQLVTRLESHVVGVADGSAPRDTMFHVEHGTLTPTALPDLPPLPKSSG